MWHCVWISKIYWSVDGRSALRRPILSGAVGIVLSIMIAAVFAVSVSGCFVVGAAHAGEGEYSSDSPPFQARSSQGLSSSRESFELECPVLFVDGLARSSDVKLLSTFAPAVRHLQKLGVPAYQSTRDAFGSIQHNAELLADDVEHILSETGAEQLHIVAHSKGGLDARYLIQKLGFGDRVATLVTIATPHRGTAIADFILENLGAADESIGEMVDWFAILLGDSLPDSERALRQLTPEYMRKFNKRIPNHSEVVYISYAAVIGEDYPNPAWDFLADWMAEREGANDGLVSVESARWGEFRGIVNERYGISSVGHRDVVGDNPLWGNNDFPHLQFIEDVVRRLEE